MSIPSPRTVAVVGAGMVGLSTAWFLQERGVDVTVFDAATPGSGASWGNAGWITPTLSTPLTNPAMVRQGLRSIINRTSPLHIPLTPDPGLVSFLIRILRNSTAARWRSGVRALVDINRQALDAFDVLTDGGVNGPLFDADEVVFAYTHRAGPQATIAEGRRLSALGQHVDVLEISAEEARQRVPILSAKIDGALLLGGQRFLDPPAYIMALADSVDRRGGTLHSATTVQTVHDHGPSVRVAADDVDGSFDAVVLATGADLSTLAREYRVRTRMRAGRGYSFAVDADEPPTQPVYFPEASVVCTPLGDRMRITGMMEFAPHGASLNPRRIASIVESVRPLLRGVDFASRDDEWVGSRPCTQDGLPLVGATRSPRVFVAGGHAMEEITLGPATGRLLAETVHAGTRPAALAPFDPLR